MRVRRYLPHERREEGELDAPALLRWANDMVAYESVGERGALVREERAVVPHARQGRELGWSRELIHLR